jgi:periplasmic protein TonB
MFDLITGHATHIPQRPALPLVISTTLQVVLIATIVAVPLLFITERAPQLPTMMAFVAPPPPPPPPPPPAPAPARPRELTAAAPVPTTGSQPIPLTAPSQIAPEPAAAAVDDGVPGGVEGGIPGGIVGGIVGGLPTEIAPPPAPEPPPPPRRPIRIGGQIEAPSLLHRVEPLYPDLAVRAHVQGLVILEAVVDEQGRVANVTVLRSVHPILDREALAAVRQWRYRPLQLNGIPVTFVLTVTLSFSLQSTEASE